MQRFEQSVFRKAAMVTTVSEDDEKRAREWGARRTRVVPNAVDPEYFRGERDSDARRLIFLGSLDWFPNEDAVRYLIEKILPLVRQEYTVDIVGRKPSGSLRELLAATKRITLHADVADVRPFLRRAGAMIVPLRIGGGSRIKILEALASQLPVISTTVGAEGLGFQPGREIELADTPAEIAAAIERAISDPVRMNQLAARGHQVVLERYTWRQSAEQLERAWCEVVGQ
jgi:glycosyltransferase involved in cell wall biosynthesis